jgi:hypothetical protein
MTVRIQSLGLSSTRCEKTAEPSEFLASSILRWKGEGMESLMVRGLGGLRLPKCVGRRFEINYPTERLLTSTLNLDTTVYTAQPGTTS